MGKNLKFIGKSMQDKRKEDVRQMRRKLHILPGFLIFGVDYFVATAYYIKIKGMVMFIAYPMGAPSVLYDSVATKRNHVLEYWRILLY